MSDLILPEGTVSFLFTDLQGSTRAWELQPEEMKAALARHDSVLTDAVDGAGGVLFKKTGDGVCAAFKTPESAISAAVQAQKVLSASSSESGFTVPARMAVYMGPAEPADGDYVGPTLNRTARVLEIAHGGQIIVAEEASAAAEWALPQPTRLKEMGFHRLRDLEQAERIYQVIHPDIPVAFPQLRSLSAFSHNLPIQLTRLIGREREAHEVAGLLASNRLVTIAGSGGAGKTRLALHVAAETVEQFQDGAWFVDLASVDTDSFVAQTVAATLDVREDSEQDISETLRRHLESKSLLLILDNCEQIVGAAAALARSLLQRCRNLKILATSREYLSVAGEVQWRIPALSLPTDEAADSESVRLFVDRAALCKPGFALTKENAGAITSICTRLDGIPLAIELAAARASTLTPWEIEQRLGERLLRQSSRSAVPRHQTLRDVMNWSYDLLTNAEKALFRRLSVFKGGFILEAAESVTVDPDDSASSFESFEVLDLITRLLEKSLISQHDAAESGRFWLLQMLREYGESLLEESEANGLRDRHAAYFTELAEQFEGDLSSPRQQEWLQRIAAEHDNVRGALDWCMKNSHLGESGLLLAGDMARFWHIRGFLREGRGRLSEILKAAPDNGPSPGRGKAYNGAGILAWAFADRKTASKHLQNALEIWRGLQDREREARALSNLGLAAIEEGNLDKAETNLLESLKLREELGDKSGTGMSLNNLCCVAIRRNDYAEAKEYAERSLALGREIGDSNAIAGCLNNLGETYMTIGDRESARPLFEESLQLYRELEDRANTSIVLCNLGDALLGDSGQESARAMYEEALSIAQEIGDEVSVNYAREALRKLELQNNS